MWTSKPSGLMSDSVTMVRPSRMSWRKSSTSALPTNNSLAKRRIFQRRGSKHVAKRRQKRGQRNAIESSVSARADSDSSQLSPDVLQLFSELLSEEPE